MFQIHRCKLLIRSLVLSVALAGVPATVVATTSAPANAADCSVSWGSLRETSDKSSRAKLVDIRAGRHRCFDRLVLDLNRRPTGYSVRYVRAVRQDGSGKLVRLRGRAQLEVVVQAPAHNNAGEPTYDPANKRELVDVEGYRTFRQVAWAGDFEGQTTVGLGVRARLPFRAFTLRGPGKGSRLVIDVARHW
ncbi:MAG TPA: hypothetical protein VFJ14_04560 [Nocardioidaceae bacterium]|nr:hypothetical protein [Nocardioidaceae bacterium]